MDFEKVFESALDRIHGAKGAILMGFDGILVSEVLSRPEDGFQELAIEYSRVLKQMVQVHQNFGDVLPSQITVTLSDDQYVFRILNIEYFCAIRLGHVGYAGQAKFHISKWVPDLVNELSV